eukprot:g10434.t1
MTTSLAWEHFRHSNIVSTSASSTQMVIGEGGDSDGAEEDGFVGSTKNGSQQEMMMQIMDKYVQAGEALAWKENEVLDLTKQVQEVRAVNSDLEARLSQLTTSNEKLLDSEGRWYSLARELENQMDVIKKGETYSLFQDKVDEAEARLEVATDANNTCRRRLFEVYGVVSADFKDKNNDGGDEDVDEHRLHATILEQLQHLKSTTADVEDALATSRDANSAAELARQQAQAREMELRNELEVRVSELREEAAARDAAAQAEQGVLRDAFATQAQELAKALKDASHCREACTAAEAAAQASEDARLAAVGATSTAESNLEDVRDDLRLAKLEIQSVREQLAEARAALEASQHQATSTHEAQESAESKCQQLSDRVVELEGLLEGAQSWSSKVESDLAESSHRIVELTQVTQVCQREVAEATTKSGELQAYVDTQEERLRESLERVAELSDTLQMLRSQLNEKDDAISRAESEAQGALHGASAATENAERLRREVDRVSAEASATTQEYTAQVEGLREELKRVAADASSAGEHAALVQELRRELDLVNGGAASAAQESASLTESLRQELESANAALHLAQQNAAHTERLIQELETAKLALSDAKDGMALSDEARLASEARAERAERARMDAEDQVEALRERLASSEARADSFGTGVARAEADSALQSAQRAAASATQALSEVKEDVLRAEMRSTSAEQASEESRQQVTKLEDDVRGLEKQLSEAKAISTQLERRLAATQAELDETTVVLKRAEEAMAATAAVPGPTENGTALSPPPFGTDTVPSDACADTLFSSPAPDYNPSSSTGGEEALMAVANGAATTPRSTEAEQLQAHAEAMELELRYTLESFEGQLSAMAREKVAIQKQVKELTGQCTTLRKQVSHYKKVAKESEAQVEQVLELQQQLCDAESAAESLRETNSTLRGAKRDLTSKLEVLRADSLHETHETMWRQSQDEVNELRARLADAEENLVVKFQELAAKEQEATSARIRASTVEQQMQEAKSEVAELKGASLSTAEELASALASVNELRCSVSKVAELQIVVSDLEAEKRRWEENVATLSSQLRDSQQMVDSLEEEKARVLQTVQQAEEGRAMLVVQLGDIANLIGCECSDGEPVTSLDITDKVAAVKRRLTSAEDLLKAIALGLQKTAMEGEVGLESGLSWIVNAVSSLQRRLHVAESELSQRPKVEDDPGLGDKTKVLEDLSMVLDCDESRVTYKVHELKKLAHELLETRDIHVKEIQRLQEDAKAVTPTQSSDEMSMTQMFSGGDMATAREQIAVLQGIIDALKHELVEAQLMREQDAEEHRREAARLEALIRFTKEMANGGGIKQPCWNDKRPSLHRKCSSLQLGASSTGGLLSELAEQGIGAKINGGAIWCNSGPSGPVRVASHVKGESGANGDACTVDSAMVTRGADVALSESEASKSVALVAKIKALLGCTMEEVIGALSEQQAASQQVQLVNKILGDVKHSYLNNMGRVASAIGHEVAGKVAPLFAQTSDLCSKGACLTSTLEGLEVMDEATSLLTISLQDYTAATPETAKVVALRQAQEEVATLNETLRKERLMMMAFRRWGHFYLALSNEALRKRTQEQNQARIQRDTADTTELRIMDRPRNERGRSRRSSSACRRSSGGQRRLQLSSSDVQAMVEHEAESVARELAGEPSLSLLALADARKEMDDIAMKAQATLGVLYAQPPLTQDANVATDGTMETEVVEPVPEGKKVEESTEGLPSGSTNPSVHLPLNDAHATMRVEEPGVNGGVGETLLAPPPVLVSVDDQQQQQQQQQGKAGDLPDATKVPETDGATVAE